MHFYMQYGFDCVIHIFLAMTKDLSKKWKVKKSHGDSEIGLVKICTLRNEEVSHTDTSKLKFFH